MVLSSVQSYNAKRPAYPRGSQCHHGVPHREGAKAGAGLRYSLHFRALPLRHRQ